MRRILVQPLAYRDPIPYSFVELDADRRIQGAFKRRLQEAIEETRRRAPAIDLIVTDPDASECRPLTECPSAFPATLPAGAGIFSCRENPWETTHLRANGDVVTCGWRDHDVIGNLAGQSMREIWQGEAYYRFRQNYMEGREARCLSCHWKEAYLPGTPVDAPRAGLPCAATISRRLVRRRAGPAALEREVRKAASRPSGQATYAPCARGSYSQVVDPTGLPSQ